MTQPKLRRRRVSQKETRLPQTKIHSYHIITDAQHQQAAKKRTQATNVMASIAGIKRTGGFGIA